jgi:DNA-binding response OmpR family regulator
MLIKIIFNKTKSAMQPEIFFHSIKEYQISRPPTIVVIDDEKDILDLLKYSFNRERANVITFTSGGEALQHIKSNIPDIIICDWMMDDMEGIDICRYLKMEPELSQIPFIMLTAKDHEADIVSALEMGADDYILKPIKIKELIIRVKKIIKRNEIKETNQKQETSPKGNKNIITYNEITMDLEKYKVFINEQLIDLTYSEFKLLQLLIHRKGRVYSRMQIIESLNGIDYMATERSVDVQVVGLRKKLMILKDYLETVRGVGYRMKD